MHRIVNQFLREPPQLTGAQRESLNRGFGSLCNYDEIFELGWNNAVKTLRDRLTYVATDAADSGRLETMARAMCREAVLSSPEHDGVGSDELSSLVEESWTLWAYAARAAIEIDDSFYAPSMEKLAASNAAWGELEDKMSANSAGTVEASEILEFIAKVRAL